MEELWISDENRQDCRVERFEVNEGCWTLGVFLELDGNNRAEVEHMHGIGQEWAEELHTGVLSVEEAR